MGNCLSLLRLAHFAYQASTQGKRASSCFENILSPHCPLAYSGKMDGIGSVLKRVVRTTTIKDEAGDKTEKFTGPVEATGGKAMSLKFEVTDVKKPLNNGQ